MRTLAGIWNRDGTPVAPELVKSLKVKPTVGARSSLLPDESLMIIHERARSTSEWLIELQPYRSAGGALLSWDGRLDNRDELVSELAFPKLSMAADVVIVGAAFDHWAEACFAKLVGDWAVSIWEPNQRHVFLARDYIGIKHLFYSLSSIALVWCNDLARLVEALGHLTLCEEYIAGFLASFPNAALTPYREILSVPPGAFVCCSAGKVLIQNYWSWDPQVRTTYKSDRDYEEHYRYRFRQAVRRRLRTTFPVLA